MKWLISGGCGFIGRALVEDLLGDPKNFVRVVDNLSTGTRAELKAVSDFVEFEVNYNCADWSAPLSLVVADILDDKAIEKAITGAEIVVHLAANTGVPLSVEDPVSDCRTNVLGIVNMLEGCRVSGSKRFVFASSGAPLGVQSPPLHEELAPHPASPYGASKLAGEGYCSAYYHCFGIETVAMRFGNVYGEGSGHKSSIVAKFIRQSLAGEQLEIYGDGSQTRDYIHISDIIEAIRKCALTNGIGGEVFQIATASETTVLELTEKILQALSGAGIEAPEVAFTSSRKGDVVRNYSDTSKASKRLGWSSSVPLEEGLERTVRYFVEQNKY